jgi:hypothetical protein
MMFGESFIINPDAIENVGQRGAIQGIAADTLRAAGVHIAEDDRTPFDILASMPEVDAEGEAKVRMIAVIAGLGDPQ